MAYAYSTYIQPFPRSQQEVRRTNQHLNQTYGTAGWTMVSVTPTADGKQLVYAFQKAYAGVTANPAAAPAIVNEPPPLDPLGQPDLLDELDTALSPIRPTRPTKKKATKKKASKKKILKKKAKKQPG
ncbi:MAG: hypothetical protein AAF750_03620 [Planctomycetota bacterium]